MKHISILIPDGDTSLSNLEACFKMFTKVNEALERSGRLPLFRIRLVGLTAETVLANGLFVVKPECSIADAGSTDLVIIPAVHGDMEQVLSRNAALLPWIRQRHAEGAEIASLCIGAFLLAATGLLDGRSCTTHWLMADEFRSRYPSVNLVPYKIITDESGIYTSGGAYSSLNLLLYLVEKYTSRDMALLSSKIFEIEIDRKSQSPFVIFSGQKDHDDEAVRKAQLFIEENFSEKITVDQLASLCALGRRNLERRFKKATANTVAEYIQRVKVEAAKIRLESAGEQVNEVMYGVGYTDPKAFRTTFKRITGLSPAEYRNKYFNMQAV